MPSMETEKIEPTDKSTKLIANDLLDVANDASERVSKSHIGFMSVCVYVLIIVFGTSDLDLLVGTSVKLPIANVDVPLVGFYAFAPYVVVLAHFNLLLQLQLLSRKLFVLDEAITQLGETDGIRDRLNIFPFTYYLVGRSGPVIRTLVGLIVSITLVVLPVVTLFTLQLRFLAYQSELVTWCQRIAAWMDVVALMALWPIIHHSKDDWRKYGSSSFQVGSGNSVLNLSLPAMM